ncbi:MAG: carbohydrate ABC transporter permease [Lachnospiraceae bacterium]|nr:carbohydrate ABC transporter permease [Lachnospiraceae bacterium]
MVIRVTNRRKKVKLCREDKIYYAISTTLITLFFLTVLYPIIYVISASFSSGRALMSGKVFLWPVDVGFEGYNAVFKHKDILTGYANTIFYTVVGTFINVSMTLLGAYPLSRKDLPGRGWITFFFTFTMFISGGTIPNYLLVKNLGMMNTRWAILIPGAISMYNMLIVRNFMQSNIPGELQEAAQIDGCNDSYYFFKIILPLSKATIAVITLYYAVSRWNSYFTALIYLNDRNLIPLQLILREILVNNEVSFDMLVDPVLQEKQETLREQLKYALIIVSSLPIMCVYPFIQKYFVKGVMVGSIKG